MFLLICKLYICIQNVFGHIFYRSRLHLYWQFWQFEVQKLASMLILAAGDSSPYLSSVPPPPPLTEKIRSVVFDSFPNIYLSELNIVFTVEEYKSFRILKNTRLQSGSLMASRRSSYLCLSLFVAFYYSLASYSELEEDSISSSQFSYV